MSEVMPANGSGPATGPSAELMAVISDAAGQLRQMERWRIAEGDLLALARGVEAVSRTLAGVSVRLAGELVDRGAAETLGARDPAAMLREALHIPIGAARARVRIADACLPGETLSGHPIEAELPEVLAALDSGELSEEHATVVVDTMTALPKDLDPELRRLGRDLMMSQARLGDAVRLRRVGEQLRQSLDPDGSLDGRDPVDRAELHVGTRRRDGLTSVRGLLDPMTTEALRKAIEPLAEPRKDEDGTPDSRPAPARRAQALGEVLRRYLVSGRGPIDGGVRPQVVVTIPLDNLRDRAGSGWADYTGPISAAAARLLACDAEIIPQVLGSDSVLLDQGRAVRLFPSEIRRAIVTRDRGCAWPGCDTPADWCDAHHVRWWGRDFGPTSERNGCLLCSRHHTLIHRGGWEIRLVEHGRPEFIPPPWIDPTRTPKVNTYWMLPTVTSHVRR